MKRIYTLILGLVAMVGTVEGQIAAWQFGSPESTGSETTYNATTKDPNLNTPVLSRGSGIGATALARGFSANNFPVSGTRADAITNNRFFQFAISTTTGYKVSLSTLDVRLRRTAAGPNAYAWMYSIDGVNFADVASDVSFTSTADGVSQTQIDLRGISALQNVSSGTTITFRLYAWGATQTTGTFAIGRFASTITTNSLSIGGTVTEQSGSTNPVTNFNTVLNGNTTIDLSWTNNAANNDVLLLFNTTGSFTAPDASTAVGQTTGGGTVLVNGQASSYSHTSLNESTTYYYRIFAKNGSDLSTSLSANRTTGVGSPTKLAITSISPSSPVVDNPFSVTVQLQSAGGAASAHGSDFNITLSIGTGSGTLGGTVTRTLTAGQTSVTFTNLTLNQTQTGATLATTNTGSFTNAESASFSVIEPPTYTWNVSSGNWATAVSWTPSRTTPTSSDILVFDGAIQATPNVTVDFTSPVSVAKLRVIGNASVTLSNAATRTLNVGFGYSGADLEVASGSSVTITGSSGLSVLIATGNTASISGNWTVAGGAHRLDAVDASGVTFQNGGQFITSTGFTGNPFNVNTTPNTVVFASGSTFEFNAGANPFQLTAPSSKLVFQDGSLYRHKTSGLPSMSGRTYANMEFDAATTSAVNMTGATAMTLGSLTVKQGEWNFNLTGGVNLKGNIVVESGASLGFSPVSSSTLTLNGTSAQSISGAGTFTLSSNVPLTINNSAGVNLSRPLTLNAALTLTSGNLNSNGNLTLPFGVTVSGTGGSITGSYTSSYRLTGSAGWRMLSSPVADVPLSTMFGSIWTQGFAGAKTTTGTSNVFFKSGGGESAYTSATNITNAIPAGHGVLVGVFADDDYGTPGVQGGFPKTISVTGVANTATVAVTTQAWTSGWEYFLAGNPYPTTVDWDSVKTRGADVGNVIYVWDPNLNPADWVTYNGSIGSLTGGLIQPFQAFLYGYNGPASGITFTQASKTTGGTFRGKEAEVFAVRLVLRDGTRENSTWLQFADDGTFSRDKKDAVKFASLSSNVFQIFTKERESGTEMDIHYLPMLTQVLELPLGIRSSTAGSFTLAATDIRLPAGWKITIRDESTGNSQIVNKDSQIVIDSQNVNYTLVIEPSTTTSLDAGRLTPDAFALSQNYPNPFNPSTVIRFSVGTQDLASLPVRLRVFDILGREVAVLVDGTMSAGSHSVNFDASNLGSGVYMYKLEAGGQVLTRRMTLIK